MEELSDSNKAAIGFKQMKEHYLSNAEETIMKKEFRKASELLWGSVTQTVKLLALLYGIKITQHSEFRRFVMEISKESGNENLFQEFAYIETLHKNFYDEVIPEEFFKTYEEKARKFLEKMDKLIEERRSSETSQAN